MRLFFHLLALFVLLGASRDPCSAGSTNAPSRSDDEAKALAILERMHEVYSSCTSYSDEGEARTLFHKPVPGQTRTRTRTVVKPFETLFQRPDSFRFEFRSRRGEEEWERYIVWKDDEAKARTFWTLKYETREWPSISRGLKTAWGVSDGSARHVPSLLYGKEGWLDRTESFELDGEEEVAGHPCWRIVAHPVYRPATYVDPVSKEEKSTAKPGPTTIWIDRDNHLLIRIHSTRQFDSFSTERTITYRPVLGERIPREAFAVDDAEAPSTK